MTKIKRVYEPASRTDGKRVLVDRLWPRALRKEDARIDVWMKDLGPSSGLRKWFGHDPDRWQEFKKRYAAELQERGELIDQLSALARRGTVTLLFGSKEERFNNAAALKDFLDNKSKRKARSGRQNQSKRAA